MTYNTVIPTKRKRVEGSPELEDVLPGGFLASFEMTGGGRGAPHPSVGRAARHLSPQGEGREAPYHFGQVPCRGRGYAPCPSYVIPTERSPALSSRPSEASGGIPKKERVRTWGFLGLTRLAYRQRNFPPSARMRLGDKISEMTGGREVPVSPLLPPFTEG